MGEGGVENLDQQKKANKQKQKKLIPNPYKQKLFNICCHCRQKCVVIYIAVGNFICKDVTKCYIIKYLRFYHSIFFFSFKIFRKFIYLGTYLSVNNITYNVLFLNVE